uniref:ATP synthase epsilon chain, chloroplastic n=1 Tax=Euglena clara TaxID=215708 RepID=A0A2Z4YXM7_9EUGL|nr:ATPase epsilon subunit [Euglena clara]AXA45472.1 ATPase epsilon subunit [Euglena clara]
MTLEISILVPDRIFLKDSVKEIILPTLSGQMGVLTNHIPLLTGLDTGIVLISKESSSNWLKIVITGGFALVNNNKVTILVNEAELGSDINEQEAEQSFLSSKLALEKASDGRKKIELTSQFKKARARFLWFIYTLKKML